MKKLLYIVFLLVTSIGTSQTLAFPEAQGAGAYTVGARGKDVYHVTNLNDSGAGSFRDAVSQGNRTIVFDVSGIVNLGSLIVISADSLTIAGQTAPAGGITIAGDRVYVSNANELIVRYVRFRGGNNAALGPNDSMSAVDDVTNQIWDHCSFSYGGDEAASWYATGSNDTIDNVTVQFCFFAESNTTGTLFGGLSGTATVGDLSFHHNIFYNLNHRFPNVAGNNANIEVINNVTWYVANRLIRGNGSFNLRHDSNYYNYGSTPVRDTRINMFAASDVTPTIYTVNNTVAAMNTDNTLSWKYFLTDATYSVTAGQQLPANYFTTTEPAALGNPITVESVDNLVSNLVLKVGVNRLFNDSGKAYAVKDSLDSKWLNNIQNNTFVSRLAASNYTLPEITSFSRSANFDTDQDGMPDAWELRNNLNPNVANNNGNDLDNNYTNLEMYLNSITNAIQARKVKIKKISSNRLIKLF